MPAPDVAGRHVDRPKRRSHGERNAAVPVEGAGERPPLGHCFGIAIGKLLWQAVIDQRLRERTPGERLWKRRQLEEPHVPRNQALLTGPQRFGKRRGVRRGQNRQRADSVGVPACRTPGLIAAPVMTDKMSLGKAGGVEKCNDIGGGRSGAIIPPPSGSGSVGVSATAVW